jgi:Fur family ferric uptake transcriptional regulator
MAPMVTRTASTRARLAARGRRVTGQRVVVAEALSQAKRAMSAQELHARLRRANPRLGLATVYRALEAQVQDGLASRIERSGHVSAYIACDAQHHHHLVCTRCQRVDDVAEDVMRPTIDAVRRRHEFQVDHAALDFYGLCASCQRQARSG